MTYNVTISKVGIEYYPKIQNMARFYVYDMSRDCGFISDDWALPDDGLYESFDFKKYFEDTDREAYCIYVNNEAAGFALLNKEVLETSFNWNMGEFFILAKFQKKGIGFEAAIKVFSMHKGRWEVSVIPENNTAIRFWSNVIARYANNDYIKETKQVNYDNSQPHRVVFRFNTKDEG